MTSSQIIPTKRLSLRQAVAAFLKFLIGALAATTLLIQASCIIQLSPTLRGYLYGPDHSASVTLEPEKVTISIDLTNDSPIGKAEYQRRLVITASDGVQVMADLSYDHGGFASENLYRTMDGGLVLAGALDAELVSLSPLKISPYHESYLDNRDKGLYGQKGLRDGALKGEDRKRLGDLAESNYFSDIFYVGTFQFREVPADGKRNRVWSFIPASEGEEAIKDPGG